MHKSSKLVAQPPFCKADVSGSFYSVKLLEDAIRNELPHLKELKPYTEIIVPKDFSQQHFSYTIINILESNLYIDNKKTWEGEKQHKEMTKTVTVKNNAISYELERYAVKDCIYYGQPITINEVMQFLKNKTDYTDEYAITIGGDFLKMDFTQSELQIVNSHTNPKWDFSKQYLHQQSQLLIDFLIEAGSV
jgi:hypothetical protein